MKKMFCTSGKIREICDKYPTPFHLYDEAGIRNGARRLKKAFSWNKGYKEYFAVKALPNPYIMKILQEEGIGADCSSYAELFLSERCNYSGDGIMFSSNVTPKDDFVYARKLNAIINLDDFTMIDFLEKNGGIPEKICLRYNPGGNFSISGSVMGNPGEAKYGMTRVQLIEAVKILMNKGVKEFGIHSFLASNMTDSDYYPELASVLFRLAGEVHEITGANITFINLSGGIGIPYLPDQPEPDLEYIGDEVRKKYEQILVPAGLGNVALYTELGRYMTGPHGMLIAKVLHKKDIYKQYVGLDACAADLMRPAMYGAYHHITVIDKENAPCDHVYDVTGGLCENNDKFAIDRKLPEISIGDIIAIHDTGAHGHAMGYNYNGKLRSAEILLKEDGSTRMIRRAETLADYFSTLDICPFMKEEQ